MTATFDEAKLEQFMGQMIGHMTGAALCYAVWLGDELGLYRVMAGAGPMAADEVAGKAGANPRLVREWLDAQAAGGAIGQDIAVAGNLPWDVTTKIPIPEARLVYRGRIDRLDIRASGDGAQITDYKSTKPPPKKQRLILGQGRELQRVLYAMAIRTLLPNVRTIVTRLIYLDDDPATFELRGDELDMAVTEVTTHLVAAVEILESGRIAPR